MSQRSWTSWVAVLSGVVPPHSIGWGDMVAMYYEFETREVSVYQEDYTDS